MKVQFSRVWTIGRIGNGLLPINRTFFFFINFEIPIYSINNKFIFLNSADYVIATSKSVWFIKDNILLFIYKDALQTAPYMIHILAGILHI